MNQIHRASAIAVVICSVLCACVSRDRPREVTESPPKNIDCQELATAEYGYTAMVALGDASYIQQFFFVRSKDQMIQVEYRDGPSGSVIAMRFPDRRIADARQVTDAIDALRSALRAYLIFPDRNERAASDVTSALCVVDEPSLPVFSLRWLGSRGQVSDPESGKIEMGDKNGEPGATDNPDGAERVRED